MRQPPSGAMNARSRQLCHRDACVRALATTFRREINDERAGAQFVGIGAEDHTVTLESVAARLHYADTSGAASGFTPRLRDHVAASSDVASPGANVGTAIGAAIRPASSGVRFGIPHRQASVSVRSTGDASVRWITDGSEVIDRQRASSIDETNR